MFGYKVNALVKVDSSDAECSSDGTSVLPTSAAEARQNMTRRIMTTSLLTSTVNSIINEFIITIITVIIIIIIIHSSSS